jgi:hypothetical protein
MFDENNAKIYYDENILLKEEILKLQTENETFKKDVAKLEHMKHIQKTNSSKYIKNMKGKSIHCDICNCDIARSFKNAHFRTDKHILNAKLKQNEVNDDDVKDNNV